MTTTHDTGIVIESIEAFCRRLSERLSGDGVDVDFRPGDHLVHEEGRLRDHRYFQGRCWDQIISRTRASVSSAPNFGYELVSRRVRSAEGADWNLSDWRVAGCGGEPVAPAVLERFAERLRHTGFDARAFVPCYGLAEATLAVSIAPLRRGVLARRSDATRAVGSALVSSGRPVAGTEIRIVSPSGEPVADGTEGEIEVRGPGVATRFLTDEGALPATAGDGWLATGDLGVLMDGELHVSGRCIVCVRRGAIERTTSGKLRRREPRARYLDGKLSEGERETGMTSNA